MASSEATETTVLRLSYSLPDEALRGNSTAHHMVKARLKKSMRRTAMYDGREAFIHIRSMWQKIRITYHFTNNRWIDTDNLVTGMKAYQDGLIDASIVPDDTPEHVILGEPTFTKVPKKQKSPGVEIVVERIA